MQSLIRRLIGWQALGFTQRCEFPDTGKMFKAAQGIKQPGDLLCR
jgi:hypothetical protein